MKAIWTQRSSCLQAQAAVEAVRKGERQEDEIQTLQSKIGSLTSNLDKMYMDRLSGLLSKRTSSASISA